MKNKNVKKSIGKDSDSLQQNIQNYQNKLKSLEKECETVKTNYFQLKKKLEKQPVMDLKIPTSEEEAEEYKEEYRVAGELSELAREYFSPLPKKCEETDKEGALFPDIKINYKNNVAVVKLAKIPFTFSELKAVCAINFLLKEEDFYFTDKEKRVMLNNMNVWEVVFPFVTTQVKDDIPELFIERKDRSIELLTENIDETNMIIDPNAYEREKMNREAEEEQKKKQEKILKKKLAFEKQMLIIGIIESILFTALIALHMTLSMLNRDYTGINFMIDNFFINLIGSGEGYNPLISPADDTYKFLEKVSMGDYFKGENLFIQQNFLFPIVQVRQIRVTEDKCETGRDDVDNYLSSFICSSLYDGSVISTYHYCGSKSSNQGYFVNHKNYFLMQAFYCVLFYFLTGSIKFYFYY